MKDAYYFRHDSNARHDPKMLILAKEYGMAGVGRFWCLIEILREQEDYVFSIEEKHNRRALKHELDFKSDEELEEFLEFLVETSLIVREENRIASTALINRMKDLDTLRERRSEAGKKGRALQLENPSQAKLGQSPQKNGQSPQENRAKPAKTPANFGHLPTYLSTNLSTDVSTDLPTDSGQPQAAVHSSSSQTPSTDNKTAKLDHRILNEPDTDLIYIYPYPYRDIPEGTFFVPSDTEYNDKKVFVKLSDEQAMTVKDRVLCNIKEPRHIVFTYQTVQTVH